MGVAYPNGSIKIVDRSKNIFKLSQGEYIAPEKIENIFALCPYVVQTLVYGDSLKNCCVAIVVPEMVMAQKWATQNGKSNLSLIFLGQTVSDPNMILRMPAFKEFLMGELDTLGKSNKLSSLERPRDFYLTEDPFTIENEILTPTMKLKRNVGGKVYKA